MPQRRCVLLTQRHEQKSALVNNRPSGFSDGPDQPAAIHAAAFLNARYRKFHQSAVDAL
jgi:hypothetical protein